VCVFFSFSVFSMEKKERKIVIGAEVIVTFGVQPLDL
jgi:hypothetical protein